MLQLGQVGDVLLPDEVQYERWSRPAFILDVAPGPAESFTLEGPKGFIS